MTSENPVSASAGIVPWLLRGLLGGLLLFGSEFLLWNDPPQRPVIEWAVLLPGYLALAALVLDLAARYRIRDVYDAMVVFAIYGLGAGFLLNPQITLDDFLRTLVTRVMGAYPLLGLEMFGLFLTLTSGYSGRSARLLAGFGAWIGFYWGIWVRWMPALTNRGVEETSLETMLACLGAALGAAALLRWMLARRQNPLAPADLRLSPLAWCALAAAGIVLLMVHGLQGTLNGAAPLVAAGLAALCWSILWFRRSDKGRQLLDDCIPPRPTPWGALALAALVFAAMTAFAYRLPLTTVAGFNQFSLMELGFTVVGFGWLPLVTGVIGLRAVDRQLRTRQM